ncbi:hypothetical protein [Pseudoduganella violaceinigra]|uniref:hypothetical protein n=1 Tax=Pseudoduganella violaceinigra TaxID=246602 RepID=UPI0004800F3E|nr:hypothetical protein [Pseudoduganella violaceinigra]
MEEAHILLDDVRLAARYAARAGLIGNSAMLDPITHAEQAIHDGQIPRVGPLAQLLSSLINIIRPVTLADLKEGRDPFLETNQGRLRFLRIALTIFSFAVLLNIIYFADALRREQEVLAHIEAFKDAKPTILLSDLRHLAQSELPQANDKAKAILTEKYNLKREEYLHLNRLIGTYHSGTVEVASLPLFPYLSDAVAQAQAVPDPALTGGGVLTTSGSSSGGSYGGASPEAAGKQSNSAFCVNNEGQWMLPPHWQKYPGWLKDAVQEWLSDYCFQLALGNGSDSALLTDMDATLVYAGAILNKISLRVVWCLPVMFGMLGASIFVMQNIANTRTPSMEWYSVVMRITMGGIAGVVVGWLGAGEFIKVPTASPMYASFALAFLVGYCIELLFRILEKLSNSAIQSISRPAPGPAAADVPARTPAG